MECRSRFDAQEYFRASKAIERLTASRRHVWLLAFGLPVGLSALGLLLGAFGTGAPAWGNLPIWPWVFFPVFAFIGIPLLTRWQIHRAIKANPRLKGEIVRTVSAEGLECRDEGTSARFEWRSIMRVVETKEFYLIFYSRNCAYFIPRRLVPDAERMELHRLLDEYIGSRLELLDGDGAPAA